MGLSTGAVVGGAEGPVRLARVAGVLYLFVAVFSVFALYVRSSVVVAGDAAATAAAVVANSTLFRFGLLADLVHLASFMLLALALSRLLGHVGRQTASAMVTLVAVAVGVMSVNLVNHVGALLVARDAAQPVGLVPLFLDLHAAGFQIAQVFFGLWLFPLGVLVRRSGLFPRPLSVLLIAGCFGYLVQAAALALSDDGLGPVLTPIALAAPTLAEVWMVGYLLVKGVRTVAPRSGPEVAVPV